METIRFMSIRTSENEITEIANEVSSASKVFQKASKKEVDQLPVILLTSVHDSVILLKYNFSRVHITSVTLAHLNGAYKVEDGDGDVRDPYLKEHNVKTYFVINPKVSSASVLWAVLVIFEQDH